ncbi:MAG: hypothetical protein MRK02_10920 [Candidatus Scalindua sp.]|nr:hypothetical protein [Candidatus Scalindua sp.]
MDHQKNKYKEKIIAFIDILGFESLIKRLPEDQQLFQNLDYALNRIKHIEKQTKNKELITSNLEVSVFSDCIAISAEKDKIRSLIWTSGWLQAELLYVGILARGGISIGPVIHENGILYGQGIISAYRLESKTAVYPRIVVSDQIIKNYYKEISLYLEKDFDSMFYIDCFKFDAVAGGASELAADGYDPRAVYFHEVRRHIEKSLSDITEENHLSKYKWLINRFNSAVNEFNQNSLDIIKTINIV